MKKRMSALLCVLLSLLLVSCQRGPAAPGGGDIPLSESGEAVSAVETEAESGEALPAEEGPQDASPRPSGTADSAAAPEAESGEDLPAEEGSYTSREDVARYLRAYGHLPGNFITKAEARALGWNGGGLEPYAPGKCIGGDRFGNYEKLLPEGTYRECDIDTLGASSRGAKRIVFSEAGAIYYTEDHYQSFTLLEEEGTP